MSCEPSSFLSPPQVFRLSNDSMRPLLNAQPHLWATLLSALNDNLHTYVSQGSYSVIEVRRTARVLHSTATVVRKKINELEVLISDSDVAKEMEAMQEVRGLAVCAV